MLALPLANRNAKPVIRLSPVKTVCRRLRSSSAYLSSHPAQQPSFQDSAEVHWAVRSVDTQEAHSQYPTQTREPQAPGPRKSGPAAHYPLKDKAPGFHPSIQPASLPWFAYTATFHRNCWQKVSSRQQEIL